MRQLLFLFLFSFATALPAQTFRASLIAGGNFSQIDGDDLFGYHQLGANAGIRVVARLGENWRVGPEILFSQMGARRNKESLNISPYDRIDMTTVEIPLMVFYKDWRVMAEAGVSYQNLFNYKVIASSGDDITNNTVFRDNLFAIKVGASFIVTPRFSVGMRFSKHLNNIDIDNALNTSFKGKSVSVRAIFTLGAGEEMPVAAKEVE